MPEYIVTSIVPIDSLEELIRCKECFWYRIAELKADGSTDKRYKPSWCGFWKSYMNPNDYCSMGHEAEREEE